MADLGYTHHSHPAFTHGSATVSPTLVPGGSRRQVTRGHCPVTAPLPSLPQLLRSVSLRENATAAQPDVRGQRARQDAGGGGSRRGGGDGAVGRRGRTLARWADGGVHCRVPGLSRSVGCLGGAQGVIGAGVGSVAEGGVRCSCLRRNDAGHPYTIPTAPRPAGSPSP